MDKSTATRLVIRHFSDRVKGCLGIEQGNKFLVLAYFRNKECEDLYREFWLDNAVERDMRIIFEDWGDKE